MNLLQIKNIYLISLQNKIIRQIDSCRFKPGCPEYRPSTRPEYLPLYPITASRIPSREATKNEESPSSLPAGINTGIHRG